MRVVADTSALVSLGVAADRASNPLDHVLEAHALAVPDRVVSELEDTAAYDDISGAAAEAVLDRREAFTARSVELDDSFPLDDGENAAVSLANDLEATQFLCDEFNRLALVHASLTTARLLTTPILIVVLARTGALSAQDAESTLDAISDARSWAGNAYVARARETLRDA
jgi:predicted nucleic acid-binding protein